MGRDDEPVDSMEIDGQQQLKVEGPAAVPDGFNADYLRVYYGKAIHSLLDWKMTHASDKFIAICLL